MIVAGASAYPRIIDFEVFGQIAADIDAFLMVDMAHIAGLVAAGLQPSPIPFADVVTSTTHKTLRGPRGGLILAKADYGPRINKEIFPGIQGGPLMHIIAAKAVALKEALDVSFAEYQMHVVRNAAVLADYLMAAGIDLVSGGTDNHLMLLDLRRLKITGKEAEERLGQAGITVNKNTVPFDTQSPTVTSGVRIGTPAVTTRGFREAEMQTVGELIVHTLTRDSDTQTMRRTREKVRQLCDAHPLYTQFGQEAFD
jgi:glycine hydroxymethyltransferase